MDKHHPHPQKSNRALKEWLFQDRWVKWILQVPNMQICLPVPAHSDPMLSVLVGVAWWRPNKIQSKFFAVT